MGDGHFIMTGRYYTFLDLIMRLCRLSNPPGRHKDHPSRAPRLSLRGAKTGRPNVSDPWGAKTGRPNVSDPWGAKTGRPNVSDPWGAKTGRPNVSDPWGAKTGRPNVSDPWGADTRVIR